MKRIFTLLLTALLLLTSLPASLAVEYADPAVAKVQFNLRQEMDTSSAVLANVPIGANLTVREYPNAEWCKVTYRNRTGYAKTSWLRFRIGQNHVIAKESVPVSAVATPSDLKNASAENPAATPEPIVPTLKGYDIREIILDKAGVSVGEEGDGEIRYIARSTTVFNIRTEPSDKARKVRSVDKGGYVRVLGYGDDWCFVQTPDARFKGYAKTKWLFHYHSVDPFKYAVPGYDTIKATGYVVMKDAVHITDRKNLYNGADLQPGDMICLRAREDGNYDIVMRRDWVTIDGETAEYHPFVNWQEAKKGDIIGGATVFYGLRQGGPYYQYRRRNINKAMGLMNDTVIKSGERYSFLTNVGPVTAAAGYYVAGITGGIGSGIGGGICHTSSLTYNAALSLPFYIYEREPHTDEGTHYMVLEFDATVGTYSDMIFYNSLPYDVKEHTFIDRNSGCITIYYECLETVDATVLANWDWTTLNIPKSREERINKY